MADREKVIKGLEKTAGYFRHLQSVGFFGDQPVFREHEKHCNDAIAMLKEQEAVKPKYIDGKRNHFIKCGKCNTDLIRGMMYCSHCGQAVKWE